jgi:hypothetical protein
METPAAVVVDMVQVLPVARVSQREHLTGVVPVVMVAVVRVVTVVQGVRQSEVMLQAAVVADTTAGLEEPTTELAVLLPSVEQTLLIFHRG